MKLCCTSVTSHTHTTRQTEKQKLALTIVYTNPVFMANRVDKRVFKSSSYSVFRNLESEKEKERKKRTMESLSSERERERKRERRDGRRRERERQKVAGGLCTEEKWSHRRVAAFYLIILRRCTIIYLLRGYVYMYSFIRKGKSLPM